MLNNLLRKIFLLIPTFFSIFFVSIFWEKIKFTFDNPSEVVGYYSLLQHSYLNDNIRFFFFISVPLITFLFTVFLFRKKTSINLKEKFLLVNENNSDKQISSFFIFFSFFIMLLYFFSYDFKLYPVDLFHDGQSLMGGLNYELKNKLWSGSYIITGLFVDVLNVKIAWAISNVKSIGSFRVYTFLLTQIATFIIFLFLFLFVNKLKLEKNLKTLSFLFLSFISFYLVQKLSLGFREIPIFLFLIFLIKLLDTKKAFTISTIIIGFLPLIGFLWSIDRGIFLIAAYFPLLILLFLNRRFKQLLCISVVFLSSFIFLFLFFGPVEFSSFAATSIDVLKFADLSNGLVHPTPFSDNLDSSRATKNLLIMILNGCIIISIFFGKKNNFNTNHKIFLTFFYLLSIIFYKIGLTRSDGAHIKSGACLSLILFAYFMFFYFFKFLQNKKFLSKITDNHYKIIISLFFIIFLSKNFPSNTYENILNFKSRYNHYVEINDYRYLNKVEIVLVNKLKFLTKNESCFQVFTYESAISYFLNKKSCTIFPHIMNLGSKKNQLLFIDQMDQKKPKFILTEGTYQNIGNMKGRYDIFELTPKDRFPYINDYIEKNYKLYENIGAWKILILI